MTNYQETINWLRSLGFIKITFEPLSHYILMGNQYALLPPLENENEQIIAFGEDIHCFYFTKAGVYLRNGPYQ